MLIQTSRFGPLDLNEQRLLTFQRGLLGFPGFKRFALLENGQAASFWWLQSLDAGELAFVVTDPALFIPGYQVPVGEQQLASLGLTSLDQGQVLVIVNKHDNLFTGNLQGPLVINTSECIGEQLVLGDRRFTTRVPLAELEQPVHAQSA